jgi:hypothetical protein
MLQYGNCRCKNVGVKCCSTEITGVKFVGVKCCSTEIAGVKNVGVKCCSTEIAGVKIAIPKIDFYKRDLIFVRRFNGFVAL